MRWLQQGGRGFIQMKQTALSYGLSTIWSDPEGWGDMFLRNVAISPSYMAIQPRGSSYSRYLLELQYLEDREDGQMKVDLILKE
jgi:hypothetical protein